MDHDEGTFQQTHESSSNIASLVEEGYFLELKREPSWDASRH